VITRDSTRRVKSLARRVIVAALFVVLSHPDLAVACSCFPSEDHGFLIEESKVLPSNARGLVWIGLTSPEMEHFEVVQVVNDGVLSASLTDFRRRQLVSLATQRKGVARVTKEKRDKRIGTGRESPKEIY